MNKPDRPHEAPAPRRAERPSRTGDRAYSSNELMGSNDEIRIEHGGVVYRLRRTANGKLILTK